jgi:serpin B
MYKNHIYLGIIFVAIACLGIFMYGCGQGPYVPEPEPMPEPVPDDGQPIMIPQETVDANNLFAFDLYARYRSQSGNLFFSPHSISSALAMTYEGAKGQTAEEMRLVLHLPEDIEKVRSGFEGINKEINRASKMYRLTTANALWAQKDYPFVEEYFTTIEKYYGGKATNLDFITETERSRVTINNWVEDKTYKRIKDLIPKGVLDPMTRMVLTNAIYFKANWSSQFEAENTRDAKFKLGTGKETDVRMMHQTHYYNYGETDDLQILEMDYLGNELSMLVLLPKENDIAAIESVLSKEKIAEWKKDMMSAEVIVSFPKFKFETKYFMSSDLKAMGMPTAFSELDADFTGMSPTDELYISEVIHQTFVEVAEYGTEAAAATAVVMKATSARPSEEPKFFTADHPFIFIIQQKSTGNILFMGRMSDPS